MGLHIIFLILITSFFTQANQYDLTAYFVIESAHDSDPNASQPFEQYGFFVENNFFSTVVNNLQIIESIKDSDIFVHVIHPDQSEKKYSVSESHWNYENSILLLHVPDYKGPYMEISKKWLNINMKNNRYQFFYRNNTFAKLGEQIPLKEDALTNKNLSINYRGFFTYHFPGLRSNVRKRSNEKELLKAMGQPIYNMKQSEVYGLIAFSGLGNYIYVLSSHKLQEAVDLAKKSKIQKKLIIHINPDEKQSYDNVFTHMDSSKQNLPNNSNALFNIGYTMLSHPNPTEQKEGQKLISQAAKKGHPIAQFIKIIGYQTMEKQYSLPENYDIFRLLNYLDENNYLYAPSLLFLAQLLSSEENPSHSLKLINSLLDISKMQGYLPANFAWNLSLYSKNKKGKADKLLKKQIDRTNNKDAHSFLSMNKCSHVFEGFPKLPNK